MLSQELFTDLLTGDRKIVDLLVQVRFRNQDACFLIHLEHQSYSQADFEQRMFHYFASLHQKFRLPIYPVVLFSFAEPQRAEPDRFIIDFPDLRVLEFRYTTIQLNRLNWRNFLQQENPVAAALMARMQIDPSDRPKVKAECLRLLATLRLDPARMQLISGFVDTYLRLNQQEERVFQRELDRMGLTQKETVMQIVTSWMEQGIQQGIQQGLQQGLQLERQTTIAAIFQSRFGEVDESLQAIIPVLLGLSPELYAQQIPLLLTLSQADLIAHYRQQPSISDPQLTVASQDVEVGE